MTKKMIAVGGILMVLALYGCGGSGNATMDGSGTGFVSILVTDAPVDDVTEVWVQFAGVELKPQDGGPIEFVFDEPRTIDLMTLTGGTTESLLPMTAVEVGSYEWIRLMVNAEFDDDPDSYAVLDTGDYVELAVPSGSQSGLKLVSGFTVTQNQSTNLVIDWDLRQALVDPRGRPGLYLRPALRVTDTAVYGTLFGTVDVTLVEDADNCSNNPAENTGSAVYLYEGSVATPGDIGDAANPPFTTTTVTQDNDGFYVYAFHYLSVGTYTAAFTCQASDDVPDADDTEEDVVFAAMGEATISEQGDDKELPLGP
jgi:hypothetical protein